MSLHGALHFVAAICGWRSHYWYSSDAATKEFNEHARTCAICHPSLSPTAPRPTIDPPGE